MPVTLTAALFLSTPLPGLAGSEPLLSMDFSAEPGTKTYQWLDRNSYVLKRDTRDPDKIELFHAQGALHLRAKKPAFGMVFHEADVVGARRMRVQWGVADYPGGASYQEGVDNEAIMIYVFFGQERQPSGELLVPDSPYFIGFYLCRAGTDELEQPYVGHHFKKTGRFICLDHPPEGEIAVDEVDLKAEFLNSFDLDRVPDVSGISIEIDTTEADNDGHAAAFLQRIEFLN